MTNTLKSTGTLLIIQLICFVVQAQVQKSDLIKYKKHTVFSLPKEYISEGAAVGDVNKDGKTDIMSGTFWFEAPSWKKHELDTVEIHSIDGYGNSFLNFSMDVNQDGWVDLITVGYPGKDLIWRENPKNKPGIWKRHIIYPFAGNESPAFVDVNGDGRNDFICNDPVSKKVIWICAPENKMDTTWKPFIISSDTLIATHMYTHGLGYGDINGDGLKDVIVRDGWWEGRKDPSVPEWTFHRAALGPECSQMYTMDFDGDGDSDVVSASAHNYGIWWHEQIRTNDSVSWAEHEIFREFSQSHGMAFTDINGDGYPDLVTGKRFWAHNGHDPGETEPAVIYWFEFKPGREPQWIPHLIDDNSGVGLHVTVSDVNGDKVPDIVTGNKKGVFYFERLR